MFSSISAKKYARALNTALFFAAFILCFVTPSLATAKEASQVSYQVQVLDSNKTPLQNMVVEFHFNTPDEHAIEKVAIMDQVQEQFKPHILTIEKGTLVSFPNSDNIKHHVYSFSEAKSFEQGLYKGKQALPINFDTPGVVDLGCNIHDWMLGYIYVAESHYFAKTNANGEVNMMLPANVVSVSVWHPRMQESEKRLMQNIGKGETHIVLQLKNAMREDAEGYEDLQLDVY